MPSEAVGEHCVLRLDVFWSYVSTDRPKFTNLSQINGMLSLLHVVNIMLLLLHNKKCEYL